jgi:hypothetical protein
MKFRSKCVKYCDFLMYLNNNKIMSLRLCEHADDINTELTLYWKSDKLVH